MTSVTVGNPVRLQITCQDRVGLAKEVFAILVDQEINIKGMDADTQSGLIYVHIPDLEFSQLQTFMPKLRLIDGVLDVKTTSFMPSERSKNILDSIVKTLPDPVFSIDAKANIYGYNNVAQNRMKVESEELLGQPINHWVKGFNFHRYLDSKDVIPQTQKLKFLDEDYVAEILPVTVPGEMNEKVLTGALLLMKSEARLGQQLHAFKQSKESDFSGIQQSSAIMRKIVREARRMANLDSSILIQGETGTGKELLARSCHNASERCDKPFIEVNCASLPDHACEDELFGCYIDEEMTQGIFEQADGGTIFLDEVAQMSSFMQSKIIRFIEDGNFRKVGDDKQYKVNVRFICATNKDLMHAVEKGEFREDLYYRLNVLGMKIPPLRDRQKDILPLADHFVYKAIEQNGNANITIADDCREFIEQYPWPGNVRQLENVMLRAVALLETEEINISDLQLPHYTPEQGYLEHEFSGSLEDAVKSYEADLLRKLYPAFPSTRQLAKKLGLSHTAIANKLREYNINKKTVKI